MSIQVQVVIGTSSEVAKVDYVKYLEQGAGAIASPSFCLYADEIVRIAKVAKGDGAARLLVVTTADVTIDYLSVIRERYKSAMAKGDCISFHLANNLWSEINLPETA